MVANKGFDHKIEANEIGVNCIGTEVCLKIVRQVLFVTWILTDGQDDGGGDDICGVDGHVVDGCGDDGDVDYDGDDGGDDDFDDFDGDDDFDGGVFGESSVHTVGRVWQQFVATATSSTFLCLVLPRVNLYIPLPSSA